MCIYFCELLAHQKLDLFSSANMQKRRQKINTPHNLIFARLDLCLNSFIFRKTRQGTFPRHPRRKDWNAERKNRPTAACEQSELNLTLEYCFYFELNHSRLSQSLSPTTFSWPGGCLLPESILSASINLLFVCIVLRNENCCFIGRMCWCGCIVVKTRNFPGDWLVVVGWTLRVL